MPSLKALSSFQVPHHHPYQRTCPRFTWSFGWTGTLEPTTPPNNWIARFEMTCSFQKGPEKIKPQWVLRHGYVRLLGRRKRELWRQVAKQGIKVQKTDLVDVHVGLRAGAGLKHHEGEVAIQLARHHLIGCRYDGFALMQQVKIKRKWKWERVRPD